MPDPTFFYHPHRTTPLLQLQTNKTNKTQHQAREHQKKPPSISSHPTAHKPPHLLTHHHSPSHSPHSHTPLPPRLQHQHQHPLHWHETSTSISAHSRPHPHPHPPAESQHPMAQPSRAHRWGWSRRNPGTRVCGLFPRGVWRRRRPGDCAD